MLVQGVLPITSPIAEDDGAAVNALLAAGCAVIHLRKPGWSQDMLQEWMIGIAPDRRSQITLHGDHETARALGCGGYHQAQATTDQLDTATGKQRLRASRSWHALDEPQQGVDYGFISPVWPSTSKPGYGPTWDWPTLLAALSDWPVPVLALGGVNPERCAVAKNAGFAGVAVLGWLWQDLDATALVNRWQQLLAAWAAPA